jgi:hypothetical protein
LSNNQFTGSLSQSFFIDKSPNLQTFIALSNCLTGSLPESLCEASKLISLILDGLSTADNCRIQLFPDIPDVNSFTLRNGIDGTIPGCLYSMRSLQTLHLSGNDLTGSIPSSGLAVSSSLIDLTLSHNTLTGTIPEVFLNKNWINLDLSYNKLRGTLSGTSFNALNSQDSSLSLEVNRLSGNIPSALLNLENVSVLNGNIFECDFEGNDLPANDPDYKSYSCGSNSVNNLLYVWLSLFGIFTVLLAIVYFQRSEHLSDTENSRKRIVGNAKTVEIKLKSYYQKMEELSLLNPSSHISKLHFYFKNLRRTVLFISLVLLVVFLPVYIVLTVFYQSYEIEYVWNVSAVLLSGSTAAIVLLILFSIYVSSVFFLLFRNIQRLSSERMTTIRETAESQRPSLSFASFYDKLEVALTYFVIVFVDFVVMIIADILYILVVINYGAVEITLAAIALAIFRIFSNNVLASKSVPLTRYYGSKLLSCCLESKTSPSKEETEFSSALSSRDVAFLEIMTLFNILLIPILVVLIILPDCFYNAFIQSSNVTSSFSFNLCENYIEEDSIGIYCLEQPQSTSYTPPFIYLYQCSSKIIIYYVPVYLILFFIAGVIVPLKNFVMFFWIVNENDDKSTEANPADSSSSSIMSLCGRFLTPASLKPLVPVKSADNSSVLFPRVKITIQLTSYLAIIIAFGTLFPPLAVIGCWTIV